jgi:hypothetical protein
MITKAISYFTILSLLFLNTVVAQVKVNEPSKQKFTLSGTITDTKSNETVIGVNVYIAEFNRLHAKVSSWGSLLYDKYASSPMYQDNWPEIGEIIKKSLFDATKDADLIIVSGTSLQVYPANKIPLRVPLNCHRMVINNELPFIPDFMEPDTFDLFIEGNCDESFLEFASYLGWTDDLVNLIKNNKENISKKSLSLIVDD